jgi:hypothetical protein
MSLFIALPTVFAKESVSETSSCNQLILQLRAMEKAQESLLGSMVRKNESMATTLDQYAQNFEDKGQRVQKSDLLSLKRSAQAFRKHGDREKGLVVRFEKSSEELLSKVQSCLTSSSVKALDETSELVQR